MATVYGVGTYGLASESSNGLYIAELNLDVSNEEVLVPNHIGDDIGVALFNEQGTLSANGVLVAADDIGKADLGKEPTVANAGIYGAATTTITEWWTTNITLTRANRDFEKGSWSANGRPGITSITNSA